MNVRYLSRISYKIQLYVLERIPAQVCVCVCVCVSHSLRLPWCLTAGVEECLLLLFLAHYSEQRHQY